LTSAHHDLGYALLNNGQVDEAMACYRKAIDIDPKFPNAHNGMGAILCDVKRDYDGAIACFRTAIALDPKFAYAHNNLGEALRHKGQVGEAIACFKKAIELAPKFGGARTELAKAERLAAVQEKLPAFLKGDFTPTTNDERLDLASWCKIRKLHHTEAQLYAAAFAADPKLAEDVTTGTRYAAAAAALAACGQGKDANQLDDKERAHWRRQALDWLRCDLAWWGKELANGNGYIRGEVRWRMRDWQAEPAFAAVRTKDGLARLPDAERKRWETFWSDVDVMLRRVTEPE
jgi:serine/threonine-protein kinase